MAKGIRVNQLAKELNVESKLILQKMKDEGLADKAPNHMSVLSLGLSVGRSPSQRNCRLQSLSHRETQKRKPRN